MRWFPWVSREMHEAVCAEKDRHIVSLRAQIAGLEKRLHEPIAVTVEMPENLALLQPAVFRDKRPRKPVNPEISEPVPEPIDWARLDENSYEQIAKLAAQELGRPVPAHILSQTVNRIKARIRMARTQALIRSQESGQVGTIVPPDTKVAEEVEEPKIPEHIRQRIAEAERV